MRFRMLAGTTLAGVLVIPDLTGASYAGRAVQPTCLGHPATIVGTDGHDVLDGGAGRDQLNATAGDDSCLGFEVCYAHERC